MKCNSKPGRIDHQAATSDFALHMATILQSCGRERTKTSGTNSVGIVKKTCGFYPNEKITKLGDMENGMEDKENNNHEREKHFNGVHPTINKTKTDER